MNQIQNPKAAPDRREGDKEVVQQGPCAREFNVSGTTETGVLGVAGTKRAQLSEIPGLRQFRKTQQQRQIAKLPGGSQERGAP